MLNARQIHRRGEDVPNIFPKIILLAMEDVTDLMVVAETLADHAKHIERKVLTKTQKLEIQIKKLKKEISSLKSNKK
jgi:hypothetical protein